MSCPGKLQDLEAKSGPLSADRAELAGRLKGLERRLKDAESAKAGFEWRCRGLASEKAELADMVRCCSYGRAIT